MNAKFTRFTLLAGVLVALAPAFATAQVPAGSSDLLTRYGEYVLVGGGVTNYFEKTVKDRVDTGVTWDARAGLGSRSFLGAELAYVGSARAAHSLGTNLVTNGVEGVVRVQYPWHMDRWLVEPFAFGGAGWTHFKLNSSSSLALQDANDLFVVPVGAGVMAIYDHIVMDARFTYRQTFDESLIPASGGSAASLKSWAITGAIGYEF